MQDNRVRKKDSARLTWDSKPRRAANPKDIEFQTAEVVIPNPQIAGELPLSFRDELFGEEEIDKQKLNRLIWGDNLLAMQALLVQGYEGKINLIYIDPPFDSKADYSYKMVVGGNEFIKEPSVIERLAYKDTWAGGTDSYLDMFYPRIQLMKRLLSDTGTIWVHLDDHVGHYIKVILDEVFGKGNFINEIIWYYPDNFQGNVNRYANNHNFILVYAKNPKIKIERVKVKLDKPTKRDKRIWDKELSKVVAARDANGKIIYETYTEKTADDVWTIGQSSVSKVKSDEYLGFDTQKPRELLKRIILSGSKDNELVADFFAGSGTTLEVAEMLNRRWIGCELGKVGIQVTRARLVEMESKPFLIENIGNYQREMIYLTGSRIWEMQHLILKLYGATPRDKMSGLGIRRTDDGTEELVYVGYPDRPVTARKTEELALQAQKLDGRGYKRLVILAWDYEYNYHQALEARIKTLKDKLRIKIESRDIPPDIYDYLKKAKSEEDIEALADKVRFYARPYLRLGEPEIKDLANGEAQIMIAIKRYVLMDIPVSHTSKKEKESYNALMKLAKDNFVVLIDYWAIDWDFDGYTFKSQWQAFRGNGRKAKTVPIVASETLEKKKGRNIAVRVVDIFGNDATAFIKI